MASQAGWYADPNGDVSKLRYWDGEQWTDQYMDAPATAQPVEPTPSVDAAQGAHANDAYANEYEVPSSDAQAVPVPIPVYQATPVPYQLYPMTDTDRTLRLIAFILNVVSTVGAGFLILPLAWMIPMTVRSYGIYKGTKPNTVAFDVCTLIFMGIVSGILLLVSHRDD